jgi:hypothetical protein
MAENKRYKVDLELHSVCDGRVFLNFWNYYIGDDVVCEIVDGKLIQDVEDNPTEISFFDFLKQVDDKILL